MQSIFIIEESMPIVVFMLSPMKASESSKNVITLSMYQNERSFITWCKPFLFAPSTAMIFLLPCMRSRIMQSSRIPSSSMTCVKKSFEGQQAATLLGHSFNPSSIRNALIMQVKTIDAPMFDKPGQEETPDAMKLRDRSLLNAVRLSFEKKISSD